MPSVCTGCSTRSARRSDRSSRSGCSCSCPTATPSCSSSRSAFALAGVALLGLLGPDVRARRDRARSTGPTPPPFRWRDLTDARLRPLLAVAAVLGPADHRRRLHLPRAARPRWASATTWFPLLLRRHQRRLPAAGRAGRPPGRPGRAGPHPGRWATSRSSAPTCAPSCPTSTAAATVGTLLLLGTFYAATDGVIAALAGPPGPRPGAHQRHRRRPDRGGARPDARLGRVRAAVAAARPDGRHGRPSPSLLALAVLAAATRITRLDGAAVTHVSTARPASLCLHRGRRGWSPARRPSTSSTSDARSAPSAPPSPRPRRRPSPRSPTARASCSATPGSTSQYGIVGRGPARRPGRAARLHRRHLRPGRGPAGGRLVPGHRRRRRSVVRGAGARRRLAAGREQRPAGDPQPHPAQSPDGTLVATTVFVDRPLLHVDRLLHRHRGARVRRRRAVGQPREVPAGHRRPRRSTRSTATSGA